MMKNKFIFAYFLFFVFFIIYIDNVAAIFCPSGSFELNGGCVPAAVSCPQNYELRNGICMPAVVNPIVTCGTQSCICACTCGNQQNCNCPFNQQVNCYTTCQTTPYQSTPCTNTPCTNTPCSNTPCTSTPCTNTPCSNTPCTNTPQNPITPCPNTPQNPITPCPNTPQNPITPCPNTSQNPVTPCPNSPQNPVTPCPNTPQNPITPCPNTPQNPVTPCPNSPQNPVTPYPNTPQNPITPCPNTPQNPITPCPNTPQNPVTPCPTDPTTECPECPNKNTTEPTTEPTTQPATELPPGEKRACPPGTIEIDGVCRLLSCDKWYIMNEGKCVRIQCPDGTRWDGSRSECTEMEPKVFDITFHNEIKTHLERNKPEIVINNVNSLDINVDATDQTSCTDDNCDGIDIDIDGNGNEDDIDKLKPDCCIVITPRMCKPTVNGEEKNWNCYTRRYRRCGSFCIKPIIYLSPSERRIKKKDIYVIPPKKDFTSETNIFDMGDCSGCPYVHPKMCPSYCRISVCPPTRCSFYDQREYCAQAPGQNGCLEQDGCYDEWCG